MRKLKPADVKALVKYLKRKYRADVVNKRSDPRMKLVQKFLEMAKIPAAKTFMDNYATTLVPPLLVNRPTVFLPFTPGSTAKGAPKLWTQWEVICHEFEHVRYMGPKEVLLYFANKAERARQESEALEVNMEQHYYLKDQVLNPGLLALGLAPYGLRKRDIAAVTAHLTSKAVTVGYGGVSNPVSKQVIAWDKRRRRRHR
jgi:hypothetical protein